MPRRISSIICVIPIYGLYMCILVVTRTESILKCYWFCFLNIMVFDVIIIIIMSLSFLLKTLKIVVEATSVSTINCYHYSNCVPILGGLIG